MTAWYARKAFAKQSQEVSDQASMLEIQSGQLAAQRGQLLEQQALNARQTEVLELQQKELRESLEERQRDRKQRRRAQASLVYLEVETIPATRAAPGNVQVPSRPAMPAAVKVIVRNISMQPVYDVRVAWVTLLADGYLDEVELGLPTGAPAIATGAVGRSRETG